MTFTPGINLCQFALGNKSALSRLGFDQQIPRDGRHNSGYREGEKDPPPAPGHRNPHRQRRHNNRRKHGRRDVNAGCRGFLFWWKPVIYGGSQPHRARPFAQPQSQPHQLQAKHGAHRAHQPGKGGEAENGQRNQPPGTTFGDEKTGRDLAYRIAEEKHTGDGPGFKIIDMKLINDKRQNRANIRSVGVIDGIHQENHRQNHETIFRFPGVSTDQRIYT